MSSFVNFAAFNTTFFSVAYFSFRGHDRNRHNIYNRRNHSVVFNSGQKMALKTFYFINVHKSCGHIAT